MSPIDPTPDRHDSCHHQDTSAGDTFGGLGTSKEYREEETSRLSGVITLPHGSTLHWFGDGRARNILT